MMKTFNDWFRREDYGDREQLERCWASAQNAASKIVMPGNRDAAIRLLRELRETTDPDEIQRQKDSWAQLSADLRGEAPAPPVQPASKVEPIRCVICDHYGNVIDGRCREIGTVVVQGGEAATRCDCECVFPAPVQPEGEQEPQSPWQEAATIVEAYLNVHSTYSDAEREFAAHLIEVFKTRDQHPDYKHRNTVRAYPAAAPSPAIAPTASAIAVVKERLETWRTWAREEGDPMWVEHAKAAWQILHDLESLSIPQPVTPTTAAKAAAEEIVPECLSRTCFIRDCHRGHCWGCDDSRQERERVAAIITRHCFAGGEDGDRYQAGIEDACKAMCSCCADTDKWGIAALTKGSMRYWHGDYPCDATPIRTMAAAALRKGEGK